MSGVSAGEYYGTLGTGRTQSFQPPRDQTLGLEDMAGHAYQGIYFVCI